MSTSNVKQFQQYMWDSLPVRRIAVGREAVDDVSLLAIQLWPVEELCQTDRCSKEEVVILADLACDIRRIMCFVYGVDAFEGLWLIGMRQIMPQLLDNMVDWWRRRKDNRAKVVLWRRRWMTNG